jgi:hypothetical protein
LYNINPQLIKLRDNPAIRKEFMTFTVTEKINISPNIFPENGVQFK